MLPDKVLTLGLRCGGGRLETGRTGPGPKVVTRLAVPARSRDAGEHRAVSEAVRRLRVLLRSAVPDSAPVGMEPARLHALSRQT